MAKYNTTMRKERLRHNAPQPLILEQTSELSSVITSHPGQVLTNLFINDCWTRCDEPKLVLTFATPHSTHTLLLFRAHAPPPNNLHLHHPARRPQ